MKTLLSILFLFVCAFAHAQYHNVEGIRVVGRSDSTTISNVGQIQFDADDDKFRFNDGTGWYSFLREGATLPYWKTSGFTILDDITQITLPFDLSGDADSLSIRSEATLGPAAFTTWFVDETNLLYYLRLGVDLNAPVARYLKFNADYIGAEGTVFFHEVGGTKTGIQYYDYDSTAWTNSTLTTKGYVDGKLDGTYWPLSGTATATGDIAIDGGGQSLELEFDSLNFTAPVVTYTNEIVPAPTVLSQVLWADNTVIASELPLTSLIDKDVFGVENAVATITFTIHAISDDGSVAYSAKKEATFRKAGSANPVAVGTTTTVFEKEDVAGTGTDITTSGANIRLSITTPANTALHWAAYATVMMTKYQ